MALKLSPGAWALLAMVKRARQGGPAIPKGFLLEYAELQANDLIIRVGSQLVITAKGEAALHERFRDGQQ